MDEFSQVEGGSADPTGITIKFNPYNYLNLRKFKSLWLMLLSTRANSRVPFYLIQKQVIKDLRVARIV